MCKFKTFFSYSIIFLIGIFFSSLSLAEIKVQDDEDNLIVLQKPVNRIISLTPHITEILFSAGAGSKIIATVAYSDHPQAAKKIPRISGYPSMDIERIVSLKPDLVVVWASGNNREQIRKLSELGLTVFISEPRQIMDIHKTILRFGKLAGTSKIAEKSAGKFIQYYKYLKEKYSNKDKVKVFYQLWNKPLMTINGQHIISNIIDLCGGKNVFYKLKSLTPIISIEAVIASRTDIIIVGSNDDRKLKWISEWKPWLNLAAVKKNHLYFIDPDLLNRMGPRILQGADRLCELLDKARK